MPWNRMLLRPRRALLLPAPTLSAVATDSYAHSVTFTISGYTGEPTDYEVQFEGLNGPVTIASNMSSVIPAIVPYNPDGPYSFRARYKLYGVWSNWSAMESGNSNPVYGNAVGFSQSSSIFPGDPACYWGTPDPFFQYLNIAASLLDPSAINISDYALKIGFYSEGSFSDLLVLTSPSFMLGVERAKASENINFYIMLYDIVNDAYIHSEADAASVSSEIAVTVPLNEPESFNVYVTVIDTEEIENSFDWYEPLNLSGVSDFIISLEINSITFNYSETTGVYGFTQSELVYAMPGDPFLADVYSSDGMSNVSAKVSTSGFAVN